ncbi:MAG TPA: S8 family serine peptidase [Candidatus Thermoplasmatota archaeon]|jgi:subtilisin|nr:S8 family serine peptidase [Candidatus Thermoplasmatota archaeon]
MKWAVLVGLAMLAVAVPSDAARGDAPVRVFVISDDPGLRSELGVRHEFGDRFSTIIPQGKFDDLQERGVDVERVVRQQIECHKPQHPCGGGGGRPTPSDQTPYGIQLIYNDAGVTSTSGGAGVKLGHLDTGIDTNHLDLVNRIASCVSEVGGSCEDGNGHGSHTAGTAAADAGSDDLGIWGVAPEASLYTYKVCGNSGFCYTDDTNAAIDACIAAGCDVITFSIGGDAGDASERSQIADFNAAGGLFIAAAGNDGSGSCTIDYPGAFKEAIAVAAIDSNKKVASFSSRGCSTDANTYDEDGEMDFAGPGVSVESTYKGGGYKVLSGTSMATPHVAGLAVKKWTGTRAGTLTALENGVEDITTANGGGAGTGIDIASGRGLPHT